MSFLSSFFNKLNSEISEKSRIKKYVIVYDLFVPKNKTKYIREFTNNVDRRRNKIFKKLLEYGVHAQLSVFEVETNPREIRNLINDLKKLINPSLDKIYFYPINSEESLNISRYGNNNNVTDDFFI
ncbi:MAG: CRISPR-associated endonuclease Cas2 [Candidatus Muiribacteriota bacterium]